MLVRSETVLWFREPVLVGDVVYGPGTFVGCGSQFLKIIVIYGPGPFVGSRIQQEIKEVCCLLFGSVLAPEASFKRICLRS